MFIDPAGAGPLTDLFGSTGVEYDELPELARRLKAEAATVTLSARIGTGAPDIIAATGTDHPDLADAVATLISHIEVYRSDYQALSAVLPTAFADAVAQKPELAAPLAIVAAALAVSAETNVRLQQLCGAATAKSMEDCLFYRDARLVSLNEVGGEPRRFGVSVAEFHQRAAVRADMWPHTMVALSTHDTKRGEDVRARIGVLSQVPSLWAELVGKWALATPPPDPATGLFLLQNIFGVWPVDGTITDPTRAAARLRREGDPRVRAAHHLERAERRIRGRSTQVARRRAGRPRRHRDDVAGGPARPSCA